MLRFFIVILFVFSACTQGNTVTLESKGEYSLAPYISYFVTSNKTLELDDILKTDKKIKWTKNTKKDVNFGFGDGVYWIHIQILNKNQLVKNWALEFSYAPLDQIDAYVIRNNVVEQYQLGGDQMPFSDKAIKYPHSVFPLKFEADQPYDIYIRVESSGSIQLPMTLWEWDDFNHYTLIHFLLQGLFFGFVIIMALYNCVVWFSERNSIYLNYVIYILSFAIFQSSLSGIGFQFLWPSYPWLNNHITILSVSIAFASFNYFISYFFDMENTAPRINSILKYVFYSYCIFSVISIFISYYVSILTVSTFAALNISLIIWITVYMLKIKHVSAKYFAFAWSAFLIGAVLLILNKFGVIPVSYISEYTLQFGAGFEIMFLSFALAERMSMSHKEKLVLAIQINEEREKTFKAELDNLRIEKQATKKLEKTVEERTQELTKALDHLSIAHDKLQTISITDALTELHNRYYFNEHFKIEYKRAFREKSECSLIMLDIDHFKNVNDTYGHPAGDICLKYVANCIKHHAARDSDICCRYGGEEFVIILPSTPLANAYDLAEDIRKTIKKEAVKWNTQEISLSASFGVSSVIPINMDKKHRQYLINQADQALYEAKGQGRDRVVMFDPEIL